MLMRCHRFRTFAFQCEFRPSWQVNVSVIVCILIDWVISLLPRDRFERWSWQIHVAAQVLQCAQFQWFTAKVSLITPVKRVEILHLSTLYGYACFSLSCPCGRTMFEFILVLSSYFAVSFSWVSPELHVDALPAVPYFCFPAWISTLLTDKFICNCLYLNWLGNKSLAKRSFWKGVLADSCRGLSLAMPSISVSYRECVTNRACQEGRKSGLSLIGFGNSPPFHAICPCMCVCCVTLWQKPGQ